MKFNKRKVFAVALAVCLIATLSLGTLAWFSAADEVKNDFLVADSEDGDANKVFSIDVWEQRDTNDDGDFNEADDKDYANGLEYKDILPGDKLSKIAHVTNTGAYDQYVRVIVTISDATAWINAVGEDIDMSEVFVGFDASKWMKIEKEIAGSTDTVTYVLYAKDILASKADMTLFTDVQIPESLTQAQAAAFKGGFSIDVKAQAVQTRNVGANAVEAFATVNMGL